MYYWVKFFVNWLKSFALPVLFKKFISFHLCEIYYFKKGEENYFPPFLLMDPRSMIRNEKKSESGIQDFIPDTQHWFLPVTVTYVNIRVPVTYVNIRVPDTLKYPLTRYGTSVG